LQGIRGKLNRIFAGIVTTKSTATPTTPQDTGSTAAGTNNDLGSESGSSIPAVPSTHPVEVSSAVDTAGGARADGAAPTDGVKIEVGRTIGPFVVERPIFFWPSNTELTQLNVGIVGNLGTGKTQLTKSLVYQLARSSDRNRGIAPRFLIFDYKGDYTKTDFVSATGARIVKPVRIPLNLFDISETESLFPQLDRAKFFIDVLSKIYSGVGHVQIHNLKRAIATCYARAVAAGRYPRVSEIRDEYQQVIQGHPDSPLSILSDMAEMELFDESIENIRPFGDFFQGIIVLDLSVLGADDKTKSLLVVTFLNLFYDHMLRIEKRRFIGSAPQLRAIDAMLLIDEADNIMRYEFPVLRQILLQGREFGVGVLLASQYLSHFKCGDNDYREPLLTWFVHQVPNITSKELKEIGLASASSELAAKVTTLGMHECLYKSLGESGTIMRGIPFFQLKGPDR
jgi:hypothetical protein